MTLEHPQSWDIFFSLCGLYLFFPTLCQCTRKERNHLCVLFLNKSKGWMVRDQKRLLTKKITSVLLPMKSICMWCFRSPGSLTRLGCVPWSDWVTQTWPFTSLRGPTCRNTLQICNINTHTWSAEAECNHVFSQSTTPEPWKSQLLQQGYSQCDEWICGCSRSFSTAWQPSFV